MTGRDERVDGGRPPKAGSALQHQEQLHGALPASQSLHGDGVGSEERADVEQSERQQRLRQDSERIERLRADGFQGPDYEFFKAELATYGLSVVRAWIRRRQIYELVAAHGRGLRVPDHVRDHLATPDGEDDRLELAVETVATALNFFRRAALVTGAWTPGGGASITTFFAGACIRVFSDVFRRWYRTEYLPRFELLPPEVSLIDDAMSCRVRSDPDADPADVTTAAAQLRDVLAAAKDPLLRRALGLLVLTDAEYADIAKQVDMTEPALRMRIHRFRNRMLKQKGGQP